MKERALGDNQEIEWVDENDPFYQEWKEVKTNTISLNTLEV